MAREYLQKKGYVIRHTNWFYQKDELDIVAEYQGELIVVEVKSRNTAVFGDAHGAGGNGRPDRTGFARIIRRNIGQR